MEQLLRLSDLGYCGENTKIALQKNADKILQNNKPPNLISAQ